MKRVLIALALCAPLLAAAADGAAAAKDAFVHGDAGVGGSKATACFACHGPAGNASNPEWPKLAGQHASYIVDQLGDFKAAKRKNPVMLGQAAALSDEDMRNLAAYFAAQKPVPGLASKDSIAVAQQLYRAGDAGRGLPACAACHGPTGAGNAAGGFPRIGGQNLVYGANQLHAYASCGNSELKNCDRGAGTKGQIMSTIASKLKENEIQALASYLSGLQ